MQVAITRTVHHRGGWRRSGEVLECPRAEAEALIRTGCAEAAGGGAAPEFDVAGPVCVVLTTRDRVKLLGETIRSVLIQEPRPDRLVVVDDGSTDRTPELLDETAAIHFDLVELRRHGIPLGAAAARRTGASGLAADAIVVELGEFDVLERGALSAMVGAIRDGGARLVYGDWILVGPDGRAKWSFRKPRYVPWQFRDRGPCVTGVRAYAKGLYDAAAGPPAAPAARDDRELFLRV